MPLIVWTEAYSVGVADLDSQHSRLIELVNELHGAMVRGAANQVIDGVLDRLIEYTKTHFAAEERLMRNAGYPDFAAHKALHDCFAVEAANLRAGFRAGKVGISIEVLQFLRGWLIQHIATRDKDVSRHLAQRITALPGWPAMLARPG